MGWRSGKPSGTAAAGCDTAGLRTPAADTTDDKVGAEGLKTTVWHPMAECEHGRGATPGPTRANGAPELPNAQKIPKRAHFRHPVSTSPGSRPQLLAPIERRVHMAHQIDFSNGRANMAYVVQAPWHGLGSDLPAGASLESWRKAAGLDWAVEETPVLYRDGIRPNVQTYRADKVLVRSDTRAPLSIVSRSYKTVQPEDILSFFEILVKGNGFTLETAGSLRGGKRIWALARVADAANVLDGDKIRPYLLLATSYDASMSTTAQFTSIRVVCNNTLTAAVGDHGSHGRIYEPRVRIPHIADFDAKAVREKLSIAISSWDEFLIESRADGGGQDRRRVHGRVPPGPVPRQSL